MMQKKIENELLKLFDLKPPSPQIGGIIKQLLSEKGNLWCNLDKLCGRVSFFPFLKAESYAEESVFSQLLTLLVPYTESENIKKHINFLPSFRVLFSPTTNS